MELKHHPPSSAYLFAAGETVRFAFEHLQALIEDLSKVQPLLGRIEKILEADPHRFRSRILPSDLFLVWLFHGLVPSNHESGQHYERSLEKVKMLPIG